MAFTLAVIDGIPLALLDSGKACLHKVMLPCVDPAELPEARGASSITRAPGNQGTALVKLRRANL